MVQPFPSTEMIKRSSRFRQVEKGQACQQFPSIDHSHERGVSLVRVSPLADWYASLRLPFNRGECTVISLDEH